MNHLIKGMAPLVQVFDMPKAIHFYRDIIGFKLMQTSADTDDCDWCLLELNNIQLMLNTAYEKEYRPAIPDVTRIQHHADTALYFGAPDIDALYQYFVSKNISLKQPYITGYGFKAIDLEDPDGYHLCFHWPVN